jgi:hypothetical protein
MISPGTGWKQLSRGVSAVLPVTTASKFHPVGSSRPSPAKPPLATPIKIP